MRRLVADARVARLATVSSDGVPHVVPICFTLAGDVVYSQVDHKPKTTPHLRRIENLVATHVACILVDHYEEDWSGLWWVRLDGTGRVVDDPEEAARASITLAAKYPQYRERPPAGPIVAVEVTRFSGWSADPRLP